MNGAVRGFRVLVVVGLVLILIGMLDPLEGSILILAGIGLAALGALLGHSRHRLLLYWSFGLIAAGVGAMWALTAVGGIGGTSGHSAWWGSLILPYPVGWVLGLLGIVRLFRETGSVRFTPR